MTYIIDGQTSITKSFTDAGKPLLAYMLEDFLDKELFLPTPSFLSVHLTIPQKENTLKLLVK